MPEMFPPIADAECGRWVRSRTQESPFRGPWTIHERVPRGIDAYARIFHPLLMTDQWPVPQESAIRWADVAAAFGTAMHPLVNLDGLARRPWSGEADIVTPTGARYKWPAGGLIPPDLLTHLVETLAKFTTTPDVGVAGIWEGFGGYTFPPGPRLELPHRNHVLFEVGATAFSDPTWLDRAIWCRTPDDRPQTPAILWPDDRAWVLTNDVDDEYSFIGGSRDLIDALVADPATECLEIPAGAAVDPPPRDAEGVG